LADKAPALTADVAVDSPAPNLYTYLVPEDLDVLVGQMVRVPFGSRELTGYVMSLGPPPGSGPYKNIKQILKAEPLFGPEFLALARFVSQYYFYPIGLCVKDILPGGLAPKFEAVVALTEAGHLAPTPDSGPLKILKELDSAEVLLKSFKDSQSVYKLAREGLLAIDWRIGVKGLDFAYEWILSPVDPQPEPLPRLGPKAQELWSLIAKAPPTPLSHFRQIIPDALTKAKALVAKGLVKMEKKARPREDPNRAVTSPAMPIIELTPGQQEALKVIGEALAKPRVLGQSQGFLLFGITGSGKTEVYLRAAAETLAAGRGVLWLAPEIALTLGLEGRLKERFPQENVSVLHSALTPGERHDQWLKLARGASRLALGARSAVFAPVSDLGLIIVDEEHDWAYKQEDGLRYHGRDLAAWRARDRGAVLLLGSATPSLESFKACQDGPLTLLRLAKRPGQALLPPVVLLDRRAEGYRRGPLSPTLAEKLKETLAREEQALLFLNRRGLSNMPRCLSCGQTLTCPHCSLPLTLHGWPKDHEEGLSGQTLLCHACGHKAYPPSNCPLCGSTLVRYLGVGTEKLYDLAQKDYAAKVLKLDADSARLKGGLKKILESFGQREANVLVGTQMAAKGHDFPYLTLVGVVEADLGLNAPDFRAAERTFQLLSQVSGRAGRRDRPGQVFIQTLQPDHYALRAARDHDYEGFYQEEIAHRRELGYPPFGRMALIRLAGPLEKPLADLAEKAAQTAKNLASLLHVPGLEILGPAPAPVAKLRARFRYQIMVRANDHQGRRKLLEAWLPKFRQSLSKEVVLTVDVDPYHLL
jgi:primosomal protein N' (replication factor Y)